MAPNRTASASGHCIPGAAMNAFVHLDVRSYFSLKDGACSPEELAAWATPLGMPAVAMTDRDGLYGAARFVSACAQTGVRPLLGATLSIRDLRGGAGGVRSAGQSPPNPRSANPARPLLRDPSLVGLAQDAVGDANLCRV